MNPAFLLGLAGVAAALLLSGKKEPPAAPPAPGKAPAPEAKAPTDDAAAKKARADAEAARAEAEAARAEAEEAKASAAAAAELQPYKDAVLYTASALGKEPFRVQTVAPSFNGQPIGASILYGVKNPAATKSDYELALVILQNERTQRMAKGLGLRAEILALKNALAAYAGKLFGSVTVLPDTEEKVIGKVIDAPAFDCAKIADFSEPFRYLPEKVNGTPAAGLNGRSIGPIVVDRALRDGALKSQMDFVIACLALENLPRTASGDPKMLAGEIKSIIECVKAERLRRFGV